MGNGRLIHLLNKGMNEFDFEVQEYWDPPTITFTQKAWCLEVQGGDSDLESNKPVWRGALHTVLPC